MSPLARYIGKPYSEVDCWGLVRLVFRDQFGIDMPHVAVADESADNVRAIKQAAQVSGWRRVEGTPEQWDIVVMHSTVHVHCGVVVVNKVRGVLHSTSGSGVVWQPWDVATAGMKAELWRHA